MIREHHYKGVPVAIEPSAISDIQEQLQKYSPELIIEFGTYYGGFTLYLSDWFPDVPIYSIDLVYLLSKETASLFRSKKNVSILITQGLFRDELLIPFLLSMPMKKFLFIDNGFKEEEVQLYAQRLRPGDLLGIHDWPSEVHFENVKHVLDEFNAHPINKKLSEPGFSETRFFIRKRHSGREKLPNDIDV